MDPYLSIDVNRFPVIAAVPGSGMNYKDAFSLKQGPAHLCNRKTQMLRLGGSEIIFFMLDISGNPETTDLSGPVPSGISVTERYQTNILCDN